MLFYSCYFRFSLQLATQAYIAPIPMPTTRHLSTFGQGFRSVFASFHFIANHKLWTFLIFPLLMELLLASTLFALLFQFSGSLTDQLCAWIGLDDQKPSIHDGLWYLLKQIAHYMVQFLIGLFSFMIYRSFRKNLIVLLCAPIMAILSDRVEEIITKKKTAFNGPQFVRDMVRSALLSGRNLMVEIGITLVLFLASLAIGMLGGPIALMALPFLSILGFLVSSYYFGGSLVDFTLERRGFTLPQTLGFNRQSKLSLTGIGAAFHILLMLPVIGVSLAIVLGTTGATLWCIENDSTHQ
jgi:CysZ protein